MHTPHPIPFDLPLAISCINHQKSLAYFSHLAPLVLFFFTKRQNQRVGGIMAQCLPLNTPLFFTISVTFALQIAQFLVPDVYQ